MQHQFSGLRALAKAGSPGSNPAGMWQTKIENLFDTAWDDAFGPGLRMGAKVGLLAGVGLLGYGLATNPDSGAIGGTVGAGIIGAGIGAGVMSMVGGAAAKKVVGDGFGAGLAKFGYRFGVPAGGALIGLAAGAAWGGLGGGLGLLGAVGAVAGGAFLNSRGVDPSLLIRGAFRAAGGTAGMAGAALQGVRAAGGALWTGARGVELAARTVLTGGVKGIQGPLDAWFPFFRNTPIHTAGSTHTLNGEAGEIDDLFRRKLISRGVSAAKAEEQAFLKAGTKIIDPRKFAPNPRIVRRLTAMGALFAVGSAVHEAMQPQIAPPTLFFDGRNMRHVNDLGTGGGYGMGVMGRNSGLNMNYQDAARTITNMF
jgi:hypothetical protein